MSEISFVLIKTLMLLETIDAANTNVIEYLKKMVINLELQSIDYQITFINVILMPFNGEDVKQMLSDNELELLDKNLEYIAGYLDSIKILKALEE